MGILFDSRSRMYSHYAQVRDLAVMRAGVERDKERLRQQRLEKKRLLKQQQQEGGGGGEKME